MGDGKGVDDHDDAPDWLEEAFDELNQKYFDGKLSKPEIAVYKTPGTTAAATVPTDEAVVVFINPRIIEQDRRWAIDTLLHEMIHIALIEQNGDGDAAHAERFTAHAKRIGATAGLRDVEAGSEGARNWPQSVRRSSYPPWDGDDCPIARLEELVEVKIPREQEELVVYEALEEPSGVAQADELVVYEDDVRRR